MHSYLDHLSLNQDNIKIPYEEAVAVMTCCFSSCNAVSKGGSGEAAVVAMAIVVFT